jgi:hypothetical protein
VDKDKSIIIQVAAKIAADLTGKSERNADEKVSEFAIIFTDVKDILLESIYGQVQQAVSRNSEEAQVAMIQQAFPDAVEVDMSVKVRGEQHGELPSWLIAACKRDGITEVYDNRDGLAQNPKRPWFKAVNDKEKAYWPPRSK